MINRLINFFYLFLGIANAVRFYHEPSWWALACAIFFVSVSIICFIKEG